MSGKSGPFFAINALRVGDGEYASYQEIIGSGAGASLTARLIYTAMYLHSPLSDTWYFVQGVNLTACPGGLYAHEPRLFFLRIMYTSALFNHVIFCPHPPVFSGLVNIFYSPLGFVVFGVFVSRQLTLKPSPEK